jgi:hypothetical protein
VTARVVGQIVVAVVRRPALWPVAGRQWYRTVPDRWWRRWPPLPLPTADYVRFRLLTQYGSGPETSRAPSADDVVHYLAWCRSQP